MDKEKLNWRSFVDESDGGDRGAICKQWNLMGTPTLFVVDHNGVIRHKWFGSPGDKTLDAALERLVKEAANAGRSSP